MQAKKFIDGYLDNTLENKLVDSRTPQSTKSNPCILGIDEAGRGPVLGPMVYAIAYYPKKDESILANMKFSDSKALTESARENLFESFETDSKGFEDLGYVAKIISPNMISNCMLRRNKYNLNMLSHDTAIDLIRQVQARNVNVEEVYIDTVGPPIPYKEKMRKFFPSIKFTICEKADSKFPIVSAASVCAKVLRDRIVQNWRYAECSSLYLNAFELGSGYPADPMTKKFIERALDPVFGYPTLARFSWSTITKAMEKGASECDWNDPDDDVNEKKDLKKQQNYWKNLSSKNQKQPSNNKANKTTLFQVAQKPQVNKIITNADKFLEDRLLLRNQFILATGHLP